MISDRRKGSLPILIRTAPDGLASYQIACALEAYDRFLGGKNGVYDLTDAEAGGVIPDGDQESGGSDAGDSADGGQDDENAGGAADGSQ